MWRKSVVSTEDLASGVIQVSKIVRPNQFKCESGQFHRDPIRNRKSWVKLARTFPWLKIEEESNKTFANPGVDNLAKSCCFAIGALIIIVYKVQYSQKII
jgi:hypothetical protein